MMLRNCQNISAWNVKANSIKYDKIFQGSAMGANNNPNKKLFMNKYCGLTQKTYNEITGKCG